MTQSFKNIPIRTTTLVAAEADVEIEQALYEVRQKIHPRSVTGIFASWRWIAVWVTQLVFYGMPWLSWNGRSAVLFDLAARKFYIFGLVFWPQDFIYLALLLVICAFGLFWWTAIAGRLWCGFACPQTVYTSIFLWIEEKVEGHHLARKKLDAGPMTPRKFRLRATKHALWIAFSLWTGFTFVAYFTPLTQLFRETTEVALGPWQIFWIGFYGLATYGNAGFLREQVCKYMCPYARFQGVMFDRDSLIISYDIERGDPRGSRRKGADPKELGLGDCVDCGVCVQVCPTGIDIRNGLQYECIGCAACIDGCNQIMDKMGYPRGLIRYTTENALEHKYEERAWFAHIIRPRILIYTGILVCLIVAMVTSIALRNPLRLDVMRDRNSLVRETDEGLENVYQLNLINTDERPHRLTVTLEGIDDAKLKSDDPLPLTLPAATSRKLIVRVVADPSNVKIGTNKIGFKLEADTPSLNRTESSTFIAR